ncbi:MAG: hypothetical protein IPN71_13700 [Fibrobacteres bacterium]|nr:hypothetical protein [Fibrobacterota bacterium]
MKKRLFLGLLVVALAVWGWALAHRDVPATNRGCCENGFEPDCSGEPGDARDKPFPGPWSPTDSVVRPRQVAKLSTPAGPSAADSLVKTPKLQGVVGGTPPMAI